MCESPELRSLLDSVQTLTQLQQHFAKVAPPNFAQSCQVLGLRMGTLSIGVNNGTLAAKLRQLAPELVSRLQDRGCEVSGIRVKVQVSYTVPRPRRIPRTLPKSAKSRLHELAEQLADTPLGKALDKLSKD